MRKIITLIGLSQAKIGRTFLMEYKKKCRTCKLYKVCVGNLRRGMVYKIINVRTKKHFCPVTGEYMKVVEVIELPFDFAISVRQAVEGAIVTFHKKCSKTDCDNYDICNPIGLKEGEKVKILIVKDKKLKCSLNKNLILVSAERIF